MGFKRRHQSIDAVVKAKGAKKLLLEESLYRNKKSMLKGAMSIMNSQFIGGRDKAVPSNRP